jgi:hypothetical protein
MSFHETRIDIAGVRQIAESPVRIQEQLYVGRCSCGWSTETGTDYERMLSDAEQHRACRDIERTRDEENRR